MSASGKSRQDGKRPEPVAPGRRFARWPLVLLAAGLVAGGGFWWSKGRHADASAAMAPTLAANSTNRTEPAANPDPGFTKLTGRWIRPDGGYVLEISGVEPSGKMEAAYLNPRPIHVAQAHALQEGPATRVLVELRDVNYPGSTYNLVYEPTSDQLKGIYFQAALKQEFDVLFVRLK